MISKTGSVCSLLRDRMVSRVVTAVAVTTFFLLVTAPTTAALQDPLPSSGSSDGAQTPDQMLAESLRATRGLLRAADAGLRRGEAIVEERQELNALRQRLSDLGAEALGDFAALENRLRERQVPDVILARHQDTVEFFEQERRAVLEDLGAIEEAGSDAQRTLPIERAERRLSERQLQRSQHPFDPATLPHEAQQPRMDNLPKESRDQFLGAGLADTSRMAFAALPGYRFDGLPGAEDPAFLAPGIEIPLTPEIRAQAASLGHDPVAIFHWVRNQVEWTPTWGAVQDAGLTLSTRRGNAMDTASLLIALLRASGVPARYVHGTIDVPEQEFRNWAGGFEHIEEAMNYAASGGIPITGLVEGGRITQVRLEHVWVEGAIDFLPSHGAVMRLADTWLPLDPSFKQYAILEGLDTAAITAVDSAALVQAFMASGAVNDAEGWVQGLDGALLVAAQTQARDQLEDQIDSMTDPTVSDVIGGRKTVVREAPVLPSGLPYQRVVEGARYAALPEALQPHIAFGLGTDLFGQPLQHVRLPWASLNNRKVTLSFRPATADDEAALRALLPEDDLSDLGQLPDSIPAYLIQVVPELKIGGETVLEGPELQLGEELAYRYSVTDPVHGTRDYPNTVPAGSYLAFGMIGSNVAVSSLEQSRERLDHTAMAILSFGADAPDTLTRDDILGEAYSISHACFR